MSHHINDKGEFQSDKHTDLPPDRIRLNFTKPASQRALWALAEDYEDIDLGLSADIKARLMALGYRPAMDGTTSIDYVSTLFDAIKHGDDKHRAWLKQAIEDHFAGREVKAL